ncbi:MAG: hypothetical protein WDA24_07885 [Tissierellales bacterium]
MIKVTLENKIFFIGKIDEIIEAINIILATYGEDATLLDIIKCSLKY